MTKVQKSMAVVVAALTLLLMSIFAFPVRAQADLRWEPVPGPILDYDTQWYHEDAGCSGWSPRWVDTWYGWKCPSDKGRLLWHYCKLNPWTWKYQIHSLQANAEIHWFYWDNSKQANRTSSWYDWNVVYARPEDHGTCIWRLAYGLSTYW